MPIMARYALVVVAIGTLAACAVGRKVDYAAPVDLGLPDGAKQVALVVLDHRPYVLSGDKGPSFVGLQRGGYGIPFNVNTESGKPLAEDFSGAIAGGLSAKGYSVTELRLAPSTLTDDAVRQAVAIGAERSLILEITEWKTDTAQRAALLYGLSLAVHDRQAARLARKQISGRDNLGGSFWDLDPAASAAEVARVAFERKVAELFADPGIRSALAAALPPGGGDELASMSPP